MAIRLFDLEPDRRDAILNAALKEFSQRGYENASTNRIAKEARISKPLMFHYINSKQELFLFVYDYFSDLLNKEYIQRIDYEEQDIFNRLQQSYLLQIKLMKRYPWIFEFNKFSSNTNPQEIKNKLEHKKYEKYSLCYPNLFDKIDESKFRPDLDIEQCKQFIFWGNLGFSNQLLEEMKNSNYYNFDFEAMVKKLDKYFVELRKIFYGGTE